MIQSDLPIVATGFVADTADVASDYPSAGADSSSARFQAIYWRCVATFLFGAAINAPECRRLVFSNVAPPVVDGVDLAEAFARMGAEVVTLPLRHRLPDARKWGNVFYFLDILQHLPPDARLALFDSDVVLTGPVAPLMTRIGEAGLVGYRIDSRADEDVNGLTMTAAARLAETLGGGSQAGAIPHYGGELLGIDLARRPELLPAFGALWQAVSSGRDGMAAIRTEEHFWSVAFAAHRWPVAPADENIRRIWTARNHRTVQAGDAALPAWHLPSEKRYGFVDLYRWIAARDFDPTGIDPATFRKVAGACFGIPERSAAKRARDLYRGVRHRLGHD